MKKKVSKYWHRRLKYRMLLAMTKLYNESNKGLYLPLLEELRHFSKADGQRHYDEIVAIFDKVANMPPKIFRDYEADINFDQLRPEAIGHLRRLLEANGEDVYW